MSRFRLLAFALCASMVLAPAADLVALEKIFVIRHAEKDKDAWWDGRAVDRYRPLNDQGLQRAERWAQRLADEGLVAVYTSETSRTVQTAMPLARALDIPLLPGNASIREETMADFLRELSDEHREDKAILVVGHSNTIPFLLKALGAAKSCYERLGLVADGTLIKGNAGLWEADLEHRGCRRLSREEVRLESGE